MHDSCEPDCGEDGVHFKGVFTRNLAQLQAAAPDPASVHFLQVNAQSLWLKARTPANRFNTVLVWPTGRGKRRGTNLSSRYAGRRCCRHPRSQVMAIEWPAKSKKSWAAVPTRPGCASLGLQHCGRVARCHTAAGSNECPPEVPFPREQVGPVLKICKRFVVNLDSGAVGSP